MAKIRIGDFGNMTRPAVQQPRAHMPQQSRLAEHVSSAADSLGRAFIEREREQTRLAEKAEKERAQDEERARRSKMGESFAVYQANADLLATGVGERLQEGTVNRDDSERELNDGLADLKKKILEPLPKQSQTDLSDNLTLFDARARAKFTGALQAHAKQERLGSFNAALEAYQRLAESDRPSAIRQAEILTQGEGVALLGADKAGKVLQTFREQAVFVDLDRRITSAQRNPARLSLLRNELASDASSDLAPERRRLLEANLERFELRIDHLDEIAARRQVAELERREKNLRWYVENGHEIPAREFNAFVTKAKGTEFEAAAEQLVSEQRAVASFAKLSPPQMIEHVRALEKTYGATPTRDQLVHLDKVRRFADRSIKLLQDSPLAYTETRDGATFARLDITAPTTWAGTLSSRAIALTEVSKRTGVAPKGLFPEEVQVVSALLRDSKPSDKAQILGLLRTGFGDDRVYRATMQQVAADDPVTAAAGLSRDATVAESMLRGQALIRQNTKSDGSPAGGKTLPMPGDAELMRAFAARSRDAFANNTQAGDLFFQSARAIYADKANTAGDMGGVLNPSRWDEAIEEATGGFARHQGREIVLPYRMGYGDFKDGLHSRFEHLIAQGRVEGWTAAQLAGMPLQNAGDGRYIIRAGDAKLIDKAGRDVVIDFNVSAPFKPSGEGGNRIPPGESPGQTRARHRREATKP